MKISFFLRATSLIFVILTFFTVTTSAEMIYINRTNGKLYRKIDDSNGVAISNQYIQFPSYSPDSQYILYKGNDGFLYKKSAFDDSIGVLITKVSTGWAIFSPDGNYIVYQGKDGFLYKKSAFDSHAGVQITNVSAGWLAYSPDGNYIVYRGPMDLLYKKSAFDSSNGVAITSVFASGPAYSPDGNYIVYRGPMDLLYKKSAFDSSNGTAITSSYGSWATFSPDGSYIVYTGGDKLLYKKSAFDNSNGTAITTVFGEASKISKPILNFLSSTPVDKSTGIPTNTLIALNFSKPLDQATVPGNIVLRKTDGTVINTQAITYSGGTIVFHATSPLEKNTLYAVDIRTGLRDIDGGALATYAGFTFRTSTEPAAPSSGDIITSSTLSPACSITGYSLAHPECVLLNTIIMNSNNQVIQNDKATESTVGDPVTLATGEFAYSNTIMHSRGDGMDYNLQLTYKSQSYSNGPVGISWDHSYNISLRENSDSSVSYFDGKLGVYTYSRNTDGTFQKLPGIDGNLVKTDAGYELRFINGTTYIFGDNLKIMTIRDAYGHELAFAYDAGKKLVSTTDTLGHAFTYAYSDNGRMKSITDFSGRSVTLVYYSETDTDGSSYDLKSITINNGDTPKTTSFTYQKDPTSEVLSHNILTLTDSTGKEYVKNIYDVNDRIISQKYGDGILTYSYETVGGNGDNKNQVTKTTVINKRGMKSEFSYDANGNTITKKLFDGDGAVITSYTYATNGKIATETKPLGNGTSYLYDTQNRITEKRLKADMTQPDDNTNDLITTFEYTTNFSVPTKITDSSNNIITATLDTKGNLIETKMLGVKKTDGSTYDVTNTFAYDSTGHLTAKTDGVGNTTKYEYENGKLSKTTEGSGDEAIITLFSYDVHGNLLTVTDGEGNIKTFSYDQYDRLVSSLSSEGILSETTYDANNNKTEQQITVEDGEILKSTSIYDILDQVTGNTVGSSTEDQRTTSMVRDVNGNITEMTDVKGLKTKYAYDIFDRVIEKRIIADSNNTEKDIVTKYTYDQNGNIVSSTDARNTITTYQYDHFDRMTTSTDALGTKNILTYDTSGNITTGETKDTNSKTLSKTERAFDSLGHVIRETQGAIDGATGLTTTADYDANGRPVKVTDAKGNITTVTYDSLGRKKMVTDALGNQTVLTYDKRGLVVKQEVKSTDGKSIIILLSYDKDGRLMSKTDGLGNKTSFLYNKLGQVTQVADANNNKTDYAYDVFGNVLSETKYLSGASLKTSYEYDKSNNRTKLTDANGNITTYEYDSVNRLTRETLADGSSVAYEYDGMGNIMKKTDANGTIVNNVYDSLGRLTKRTIQRGVNVLGITEENYIYDALGRLVNSTDSDENILTFTYDPFGRLISESQNGKTVQTDYDANSNISSLTYSSGKKVIRDYDVLNRLTGIRLTPNPSPSEERGVIATYSYSPLTLDSLTLANGAKTTYEYDAILRLKELTNISGNTILNTLSFGYDQNSNILSNGENNYTYDAINRLTNIDKHDGIIKNLDDKKQEKLSVDYNYDNLGNRDSVEQTLSWTTKKGKEKEKTKIADYTSNALNQYTSVSSLKREGDDERHGNSRNDTSFIYDKNGNLIQDSDQRYFYDYRNRLIKVEYYQTNKKGKTETNLIAEFQYDVLGRRTTKITYNDEDEIKKIIRYMYSNQDVIEETLFGVRDGKEKLKDTKEYIYGKGIDDVLVMLQTTLNDKKIQTKTYFYQKDQLGSITAITDDKSKLIEEYKYDEFGKAYTKKEKKDNWKTLKKSEVGNTKLFTGREYDREIGLYYYRARYYSAELGRFIGRDPIGTADDVNLYGYVGNSPVGFVDPNGLSAKSALAYKESHDLLKDLIEAGDSAGGKHSYLLLGGEELTNREYYFYTQEFNIFSTSQLKDDRNSAFNNQAYLGAREDTRNLAIFNTLLSQGIGESAMFEKYGWNSTNNVYSDALRHSYFNALNAKYFGIDEAKKIGDNHEFFAGNLGNTVLIDLYNNSIGRSIGYENKSKSDEEILNILITKSSLLLYGSPDTNGKWMGNSLFNTVANNLNQDLVNTTFGVNNASK